MLPDAGSSSVSSPDIVQTRGWQLEVGLGVFVKKGSEYFSFCKPQLCGVKATIHSTYTMFLAKILGGLCDLVSLHSPVLDFCWMTHRGMA